MEKLIKGILIAFTLLIVLLIIKILVLPDNKKYTNADFNIKTYQSKIDKDEDGINDQTDILLNVKKYISTKPKYKSKYYETGYPDDQYGVCTDVVAFGLKGAG